jgi:hypothetical protein
MSPAALPEPPDCCFIDGEHSHDAVLADARFCVEAMGGTGVIAFHDWGIVKSAIEAFVRERRQDISFALAINRPPGDARAGLGVFAVELGDTGILSHPAIKRAAGSRSHRIWEVANRPRRSALPLLLAWDAMTAIDSMRARAGRLAHRRQ